MLIDVSDLIQQPNSYDCGLYVCIFIRFIVEGNDLRNNNHILQYISSCRQDIFEYMMEDRMRMRDKCNCEELKYVECVLETKDLWDKFHDLETEMIITKTGRYVMQVCNFFLFATCLCMFFCLGRLCLQVLLVWTTYCLQLLCVVQCSFASSLPGETEFVKHHVI